MTTLQKFNAVLPAETAEELVKARDESQDQFLGWVVALREKRWPYRAIGDVFGVSRVAAQAWYNRARSNTEAVAYATSLEHIAPVLPADARGSNIKIVKLTPDVPPEDQKKLKELTERARQVGRWTPYNAPSRQAARELEELIYFYVESRKIPAATVARHAGVTRRAVVQRLEKQKAKVGS